MQNTTRLPTRQIFRDSKCPFFPALSQRIILTFIFTFYWVKFLFHSCKCEESVLSHCAEQKLKLWTRVDNDSVPALLLKTIWTSVFFTSTSLVPFFFFLSKKIRFCIISRVTVRKKVVTQKSNCHSPWHTVGTSYKHSIILGSL